MLREKRGSTYVYVMILLVLLMIMATGFTYMIQFNMSTTSGHRRKLQQDYLAKSIHRTFCDRAEAGELEILGNILDHALLQTDSDFTDEEEEESGYHATTGDQVLTLTGGETLTVRLNLTCAIETEAGYGSAVLDTYVKFDQGDPYQLSALLILDDEDGQLNDSSRWTVKRHYQTEEQE